MIKIGATIKSPSKKLESVVVIDVITLSNNVVQAIIIDSKEKMRAVYLDDLSNCYLKKE